MKLWLLRALLRADASDPAMREKAGAAAGAVGIFVNLLLAGGKAAAGLLFGSISVLADAVNNLSDAASSVVTFVGFRIAAKPADEKHPYGHARSEYISGLIVAFLMLVVGVELLRGSVEKIIHPTAVEYSVFLFVALAVGIAAKLFLFFFFRAAAKTLSSATIAAAATDSRNDVITTAVILLSALAALLWDVQIDGYMGCAVSIFILISGVKVIIETLNPLLGAAPDSDLVRRIQARILAHDTVLGLHDLVLHNYGEGRCFASVHVEFSAKQDLLISHDIIDNIEREFETEMGIHLVVHLDPIVTDDPLCNDMRDRVAGFVASLDGALSIHDFRVVRGQTHTNFIFDVTVPPAFSVPDDIIRECIERFVFAIDKSYYCVITIDRSYLPSVS